MKDYSELAATVIENVGGKENIDNLKHCVTRLRFQLKDESLANTDVLKDTSGVVTVVQAGGQYQVVIGNEVADVYKEVTTQAGIQDSQSAKTEKKKLTGFKWFVDFIFGVTGPTLMLLSASGILKGLLTIATMTGLMTNDSGVYTLFAAIADSIFYFLPLFLGYCTAQKIGVSPFLGMLIGAALCYPTINGVDLKIFGMDINATYTSTFLPTILIVSLALPVERFLSRIMPTAIKSLFVPLLVLITVVPVGFLIVGPFANFLSERLAWLIQTVYNSNSAIAGTIIGLLWQVLVVFGLHATVGMLSIANMLQGNPDPILAISSITMFPQVAAVMAIYFKTKSKKLKQDVLPAAISGVLGTTEPAIYGVTLPRIKVFIASCIGAGVTGLIAGIFKIHKYALGGGIFAVPGLLNPEDPQILPILLAIVAGTAVSFVLAMIVFRDKDDAVAVKDAADDAPATQVKEDKKVRDEIVKSPLAGKLIPLKDVSDAAFAGGGMGQGVAIIPTSGRVVAPFDGKVIALFPTKHAIGLVSENGCQMLIHVGMDTVNLDGRYFKAHVEKGDTVKAGDPLVSFDLEKIAAEGYSLETPVIVTNMKDYSGIVPTGAQQLSIGDEILTTHPKVQVLA